MLLHAKHGRMLRPAPFLLKPEMSRFQITWPLFEEWIQLQPVEQGRINPISTDQLNEFNSLCMTQCFS